jgi:hypothetical protein
VTSRGRLILSLAILAIALAGLALLWRGMEQWQAERFAEIQQPSSSAADDATESQLPQLPGAAGEFDFSPMVERPLFMSTRRPPNPDADAEEQAEELPEPAPPAAEPQGVILTSVIFAGDERMAWFRDNGTGETLRLREGETLQEWTLSVVAADHVILELGGERLRLELRAPQPAQPPPPATRQPPNSRKS